MDKPKKRVTVRRYNGVTNKAIICPQQPPPPPPIHPYCPSLQNLKTNKLNSPFTLNHEFTFYFI